MSIVLHPDHRQDLFEKSGLDINTIETAQLHSIRPHDLRKLGPKYTSVESALRFPYFSLDGSLNYFERLKLFPPVPNGDGHLVRYYQAQGSNAQIYMPPLITWPAVASDVEQMILLTEGEKKSLALCQGGLPCLGVAGVWNWRSRLDTGERLVIPTLDCFIWKGRPVELVTDSDAWHTDKLLDLLAGFYALAMELTSRGAIVSFVRLPDMHGRKTGADDWCVAMGSDWLQCWPKLERLALDDACLKPVAAWWQRWREKQATQAAFIQHDVDDLDLTETAGLFVVRSTPHNVQLTFDRVSDQSGGVSAELTVTLEATELLAGVDVGLKSDTGQTKLTNSLKILAPAIPWKLLLQRACARVLKRYRMGDPGVTLSKDTSIELLQYALNPLVFQRKTTVLYGDGGLGKSTLALPVAMLVSLGLSVAGLRAIIGRVLYLDYEDTSDVHARRLHAIQAGHPELQEAQVHYQRCVEPLTRIVYPLLRQIQQDHITFVVLDSLLAATGGDSSAEATAKLFAALRTLNLSNLVLGHIPKVQSEGQAHPTVYGSVFNQNFARAVWEVKKEQEIGEETMIVGLFNRKSNLSRLHHPLGLKVTQNSEGTRIHYEPFDLSHTAELATALPLPTQIRNLLESDRVPRSSKEITVELGAKLDTIKAVLSKYKKTKWDMIGEGRDAKWTVLTR